MNTAPQPRVELDETGGGSLLAFVAQTVRRLEDSVSTGFRDMQSQLTDMPRNYVPRAEVERRLDEAAQDTAQERADRERADRDICEQVADLRRRAESEAAERQRKEQTLADERIRRDEAAAGERKTAYRQRLGLAVTAGVALAGTATSIFLHFH